MPNRDAKGVEGRWVGNNRGGSGRSGFQCFCKCLSVTLHSMPLVEMFVTN